MTLERIREIRQLVEACQHTDNSDREAEKTAVVAELLDEIEASAKGRADLAQMELEDISLEEDDKAIMQ